MLYVIPVNIFKELDGISNILANDLPEFEVKISKQVLSDSLKIDKRFELAQKTHQITVFTEGLLWLDNVLMGVTEIEPKEILVSGLRQELCKKLANMLHNEFIFAPSGKQDNTASQASIKQTLGPGGVSKLQGGMGAFGDYEEKFKRLRANFVGLKRSLEYIQDFLNV